ncbi:MAG: Crp/Fnr family transcriptional regulator [Lachnospiraceae bacterium]|nr:Crp/Fnr family transcriptional regulator [Lachnospiraceae bacterium]
MEKYLDVLEKCDLFDGIAREHIQGMLFCLQAKVLTAVKNQTVFAEGDIARYVGIVLSGAVMMVKEDYYGNRSVMGTLQPGELFGETFSCAALACLPVSVVASADSQIMLFDCRRVLNSCSNACEFHKQVIYNLLRVLAGKNLMLNRKIEIISRKTTREKLMAFLMDQAKINQSGRFTIPYDRQELADYLGVERSAMSAEIGKLCKEGVISCRKSCFELLQMP